MNTDVILDFLVDYYIWFIVGGIILILAIVGFVADKKKLLPNSKKVKKSIDNNIDSEGNHNSYEKTTDLESYVVGNKDNSIEVLDDFSDISQEPMDSLSNHEFNFAENSTQNLYAVENDSNDYNVNEELSFENGNDASNLYAVENSGNDYNMNEELSFENGNDAQNLYAVGNDSNDYNMNEELSFENENNQDDNEKLFSTMANDESKIIYPNFEENNLSVNSFTEDENLENNQSEEDNSNLESTIEQISNNITDLKNIHENLSLKKVDETIDKINNFDFSINDNKENKLEDTMQISYSQLKEMVEDIIEENEIEKQKSIENQNNEINVSNQQINDEHSISYQGVTDVSLPKLDSNAIENIKKQDDEDDVWKF